MNDEDFIILKEKLKDKYGITWRNEIALVVKETLKIVEKTGSEKRGGK